MIEYRHLHTDELLFNYFSSFKHEQSWKRQWVKQNNNWTLEQTSGRRSWSAEKRVWISEYIKEQINNGGSAIGAFENDQIIGFVCIDGIVIGSYVNLTMLFVDDSFQQMGIGKQLIQKIKIEAKKIGADKIFISAIPSEDTIAFYFSVGCKDAETIISEFVDTEKDRYLELEL